MTPEEVKARRRERYRELSPEAKASKLAKQQEYRERPGDRASRLEWQRAYSQRPEVRARKHERDHRPDVKAAAREYQQRYRAGHGREVRRRSHLSALYGVSLDRWDRMWRDQGGLCAICCVGDATHVDHDHETDQVRSLLCNACNTALGGFAHDPARLRAAADYLERHAVAALEQMNWLEVSA